MIIKQTEFIISNTNVDACPAPDFPEYAFVGRSNVGKSSLINMLTGKKKLAKISGTPGKTQLINHFLINKEWYIVDLPGYGYAKVSKSDRKKWKKFISQYFTQRTNMICAFVLIDARLPPQKIDIEFMGWLGKNGIPFNMVFTKIDKLSSTEFGKNLTTYKKNMLQLWETLPPIFHTSSVSGFGREEILNFIEETNPVFSKM